MSVSSVKFQKEKNRWKNLNGFIPEVANLSGHFSSVLLFISVRSFDDDVGDDETLCYIINSCECNQ